MKTFLILITSLLFALVAFTTAIGCSRTQFVDLLAGPSGTPGANGQDGQNGANGKDGRDGKDAIPCTIEQSEEGYLLSCGDSEPIFVRNGLPGLPGRDGEDGEDGEDGQDGKDGKDGISPTPLPGGTASLVTYTSSSCTSLGSGYYGKSNSNSYSIYDDNDCHSSDKILEMNEANSSIWLASKVLGIFVAPNDLRVITFN